VIQRLETLLLVLQVLWGPDEFLHRFDVKKLVDVVVVSQEIGWEFSCPLELSVLSDYGLDLFHESGFEVIAGDVEGSVFRVLEFPSIGELDDPRGDCDGAVRCGLVESDFQRWMIPKPLESEVPPLSSNV
jgi:hypothetical protein